MAARALVEHTLEPVVAQRVFGIALGSEDLIERLVGDSLPAAARQVPR